MKIISPLATGNGAYVVHKAVESGIREYEVVPYHPYWTLIPFTLPLFNRKQANIIHTTPDYALFFRQRNAKMILTFHNYVLDKFMCRYSSTLQFIHYQTDLKYFTRKAMAQADVITSVSSFTANIVREDLNYLGKIKVIPNGIDAEKFQKRPNHRFNKEIKVLFCGNLTQRKGAQCLPEIADNLSGNIKILYTTGLRDTRYKLAHPKLQNVGMVNHSDIPNLYNQVDILLFPTVREGFGLVVAEAMACSLPVVATNCSSLPELIDNEKGGFLCPLGDVKSFAEKINFLAECPIIRKEMGQYNRAKIEDKFTIERMVRNYRNLFEEVIG